MSATAFAILILGCAGPPPASNATCQGDYVELRAGLTMEDCEGAYKDMLPHLQAELESHGNFVGGHKCLSLESLTENAPRPLPHTAPAPAPTPWAAPQSTPGAVGPDGKFHL